MSEFDQRFGGIIRLYGSSEADILRNAHICVIGIGGVGSWAAEALARSGIGRLTLIDHDDIAISNVNRQIHSLSSTLEKSKVEVMADRILQINPECDCQVIDDFISENNLEKYLNQDYNFVIDAIDSIRFKAAMIAFCKRRKIHIVTTGGAGGRTDPLAVEVADLSRTWNDALAAKVRSRLRSDYGYTTNPKRRFGVECVYSTEQPVYPVKDGQVTHAKPGVPGARLDCEQGYGSVSFVTGTFGLVAASRAVNRSLAQRLRKDP